jgi:hypothetical protein
MSLLQGREDLFSQYMRYMWHEPMGASARQAVNASSGIVRSGPVMSLKVIERICCLILVFLFVVEHRPSLMSCQA